MSILWNKEFSVAFYSILVVTINKFESILVWYKLWISKCIVVPVLEGKIGSLTQSLQIIPFSLDKAIYEHLWTIYCVVLL